MAIDEGILRSLGVPMDRNDLISRDPRILRSLQYFEAVARLGSVAAAAEESGVSASAVSHQLRTLTGILGEDLVTRSGRGIVLTEAGVRLHSEVAELFHALGDMLNSIIGGRMATLRLAVCSSFGPSWLADRLPDFQNRHPEIDLELRLFAQDPLQTETVADAIVTAAPVHAGFDCLSLFEEMLVPVASPRAARGASGLPTRLITTDLSPGTVGQDWIDYTRLTGIAYTASATASFLRCTHYLLALSLAKAGMGAALVPDFLAAAPLAAGELVQLDSTAISSGRTYRLCYKSVRGREPALRAFVRWMRSQRDLSRPGPDTPA